MAASAAASSSAMACSASTRGKRFSPLVTLAVWDRAPHAAALSQVWPASSAPIWANSLVMLSGMKGVSSTPQMRVVSSRLYMTVASRAPLASMSLASAQGAVSSIYLLARATTLNTSASASWKA